MGQASREIGSAEDDAIITPLLGSGDPRRLALLQRARRILVDRRRRAEVFGKEMFREPGWEILLLLYATGARFSTASLIRRVGAPATTMARWLKFLDEKGLIERGPNPTDLRSVRVTLSKKGFELLDLYLSETLNLR